MLLFSACRKREGLSLPDNLATFSSTQMGMSETETSVPVKLRLSRGTDKEITLTIKFTTVGVTYGTDFTTTPAANAGELQITVPMGNNEASFTINKIDNVLFDGDEKINFELHSSAAPVLIGAVKKFTLEFHELVAANASMVVDGGGALYPNKVFIDLSANRQTPVLRTKWDLGFYTGDDWRVILNSSSAMMARQIDKTDLNAVTAADTTGFSASVAFSSFAPTTESLAYIDYPNGDLTRTAIAALSATAAENKVYIVNRGTGVGSPAPSRGWKKIRIIRNTSGGYTLQHADIDATSFTSVDIPKEQTHFFKYVSFENGIVDVEPAAKKWDIAWSYFSFVSGAPGSEFPFMFQDVFLQNRNSQIAKVLTSTKAYADFSASDIGSLTWSSSQTAIGSDWRAGGGPSSSPSVRTDRYYILKDADNNVYKIRFTGLTQSGERGYPSLEYTLLQKG
jgi:hypothetical protein